MPWTTLPTSPRELHHLLSAELGLRIARAALVEGNSAPFDYLCHAFFEPGMRGHTPGPRDAIVWACRGGGKTFLGALATMLDLIFKPGVEVRILAGSLEQAGRMHAHLTTLAAHPSIAPLVAGRATARRLQLRNGSRAELLAQSQASVRGTRVQKLRCDEVELFDPEVWEAAQLTTRSRTHEGLHVRGSVECLSTMHLPRALMSRLIDEAREGRRALFRWGIVDVLERCPAERECGPCPLLPECRGRAKRPALTLEGRPLDEGGHITIDDAIAMKGRVGAVTWESEMLCERPRATDAVLPEFDPSLHIIREGFEPGPVPGPIVCGMDFGIRSPSVILWGFPGPDGILRIVDERCVADVSLEAHIRALVESPWGPPRWLGIDRAGNARSIQTGISDADVLRRAGLIPHSTYATIESGVRALRSRLRPALGPPRLLIHRRCRTLIESIERYHYERGGPNPAKDGPDHAVDALRYLIVALDLNHTATMRSYIA